MPAWVTIYLERDPEALTPEAIQNGIDVADWWTLGEQFGVEEDEVDAFLESMSWSADPLALNVEGRRPIQFHVWRDAERVRTEIAELDERDLVIPARVREHVKNVHCIIALEMGFSQLGTMFEAFAFEVAYWLAEQYGGLILADNGSWFDHAANRWDPIT